ncbi:MAG: hypothetical protein AAF740_06470, partial [Bacteroidota bacterium]
GIPLTSGFLSKELILVALWESAGIMYFVPAILGFLTVGMTAFYIGRQFFMVFWTEKEGTTKAKVPLAMLIPIVILALGSMWFTFSKVPWSMEYGWLINSPLHTSQDSALLVSVLTILLTGLGLGLSFFFRSATLSVNFPKVTATPLIFFARLLATFDQKVVDTIVVWLAESVVVIGHIGAWLDRTLVDGMILGIASGIKQSGQGLRVVFGGGKVQTYLLGTLLLFLVLILVLV